MKSLKIKTLFFAIVLSLSACKRSGYTEYSIMAAQGLGTKPIDFILPKDVITGSPQNIFIRLQNDNNYPYANIFLIAEIHSGELVISKDTLEYAMASPNGEWLGKGFTEVKESKLWWKKEVILPQDNPIKLSIAQAMRNNGDPNGVTSLKGILSVGISIEEFR